MDPMLAEKVSAKRPAKCLELNGTYMFIPVLLDYYSLQSVFYLAGNE